MNFRDEWASFSAFVVDGFRGRGWRIHGGGASDEKSRDEREAHLRDVTSRAIREARIAAKKTQEHLAMEAEVSVRTVRRVETTGRISFENLRSLCAALSIPLPVAENEAAACKPRVWVEVARGLGILAFFVVTPIPMWGAFFRTWKARLRHVGVMATVAAVGAVWIHLRADEIMSEVPHLAMGGEFLVRLGCALVIGCLTLSVAGILLGVAWRSAGSRLACTLGASAIVVATLGSLPTASVLQDIEVWKARNEMAAEAYHVLVDSIRKREELQPGYDTTKALALEAAPFLFEAIGWPATDWPHDEDDYERMRAEAIEAEQ